MPAATTRNTLARQWELLKLLPTHGAGLTAKEISDQLEGAGFKVSKRQVERDLAQLMETFPLDCNNASIPYGWRWMPGATTNLPGLSLSDALSLRLIEDSIRPLLPGQVLRAIEPRFRQAASKLAQLSEEVPTARWAEKVASVQPSLPLLSPTINPEILETVQQVLLVDEQLEVSYRAAGKEAPSLLRLHPLGLILRGPVTYLVATAFKYDSIRLYALHRIHEAKRTYEIATIPDGFSVKNFIASGAMQFGGGELIRLEALVSPSLAELLEETPLSVDQVISQEGERFRIFATVVDSWQLTWWVLSQAENVELIAPSVLREKILALHRKTLNVYG